jgi:hypothetical protein
MSKKKRNVKFEKKKWELKIWVEIKIFQKNEQRKKKVKKYKNQKKKHKLKLLHK